MLQQPYKIADFLVDPRRNVIIGPDGESAVEPKIMEVLCALADRPGHVFSRTELIDQVWGHAFGADESLTRAISQLRKVFGDSRDEARVLETIQKRGYRLIAPVSTDPGRPQPEKTPEPVPEQRRPLRFWAGAAIFLLALAGVALWQRPPANIARPAPQSGEIAVSISQFSPQQGDAQLSSLARAIREGLITNLSRISLIHVASASPGRPMNYRIEGSVQRSDALMRVNVQLIDLKDGRHVWAANFDKAYSQGLSMQDQFTSAVTSELTARILSAAKAHLRSRPIESLVPWELTLLYMPVPGSDQVFLAPHTKDAFWLQRRALALDPDYAPAHASLASALAYHALFNPAENTQAALSEAEKHAQIASAQAPFDPEVLYQIASYYRYRGERQKAADTLRRILEIHSDDIQARIDLPFVQGQCSAEAGNAAAQLAAIDQELLPSNPVRRVLLSHLAALQFSQGRFEKAREAAAQSRDIVKATWSGITLAAALAQLGQSSEALGVSAETKLEWPTLDYDQFADQIVPVWCLGGPATAAARSAFHKLAAIERAKR